jgi:predicted lysophospholipase L1 biosynthesis ABC-type transport system permease subunit
MRPTISRSELAQFLRLLVVAALLLGGIGVAIGRGSSAPELIAMR